MDAQSAWKKIELRINALNAASRSSGKITAPCHAALNTLS